MVDNNLNTIEYNSIGAVQNNNFKTKFNYVEENGQVGDEFLGKYNFV